jgi:uncharacterized protein YqgV (UPF0045/DUF77 family)
MLVSVQFSVYTLREMHLSPAIKKAVEILKNYGLPVEVGSMSSITYGDSEVVFKAFQRIFDEVATTSHVVIIMTLSNACPLLEKDSTSLKSSVYRKKEENK